ncbi:MAG: MBL fold metallo-hydrolase [Woeseiaceae bacterium]|nr:MBL fold metallo-hydrolase [Woeseiaceae bacterium]
MKRLSILLVLVFAANAQGQQLATEFKSIEVAPGVYMVVGVNGFSANMAVLAGEDYVAMVDDGLDDVAEPLLEHVSETTGRPVDFLVNTHVHGDHAGGNAYFADHGTVIFAHDNIRKRLLVDSEPAGGPEGIPVVTFADGVTFHLNGLEARVFHVENAHTDGDAAIFLPDANVIATGDLMFNKLFPFIDLDSGGSVDGYIAAQKQLVSLANADTVIIPGHGEVATRADLQENLDVLIDSQKRVRALVEAGKSIDEILAENPLAVHHDTYNWGFITTERMTRTLYRDLTGGAE